MSKGRAPQLCATLESRDAALQHAALAGALDHERERQAELEVVFASRKLMQALPLWLAFDCFALHARSERVAFDAVRLLDASERCREEAERHAVERRKWGQMHRALERRAARRAQDELWPD
jgi:hypothetical protein